MRRSAVIEKHSTVDLIRSTRFILLSLWTLGGCAVAEIPYDFASVKERAEPIHPYRVAMLPLEDDRASNGDGPDAELFQYRGVDYEATELKDLRGDARHRITELVARHLAKARLFAQIILVLDKSQAPEADLLLTGKIYRMRGYVEAEPPDPRSGRDPSERMVLSEVIIKDLVLSDAKNPERELLKLDAGWSKHEARSVNEEKLTPWTVLGETLFVALDRASEEIATADLSGKYDVRARVALDVAPADPAKGVFGDLASGAPYGWKFVETSSASAPVGWRGEARCREALIEQQQTIRFHRLLGPYRPSVRLWSCPDDTSYSFDGRAEFPAIYLGERKGGRRYFLHALGETNWPNATAELRTHLGIIPPSERYIFELKKRERPKANL